MKLNELTPGLKERLAPTDCRLRPDQRACELGQYDEVRPVLHLCMWPEDMWGLLTACAQLAPPCWELQSTARLAGTWAQKCAAAVRCCARGL